MTQSAIVNWRCSTCGGEYPYRISLRTVGDDSCPYCRGKEVLPGFNSLVDTNPELAAEWGPSNGRGPEDFMKSQSLIVYWKCKHCGGEYPYKISLREVGDDSCPYCSGKKVLSGFNSLADTDPELAAEWSSTNERGPESYMKTQPTIVLWTCGICGAEYPYKISLRTVGDDSCPYCSGKKVLPGYNSLKALYPDLMEEWDEIDNYLIASPDEILPTSRTPVWWRSTISGKSYLMSPRKRIELYQRNMIPCPYDKGYRRKMHYFI